MARGKAKLKKGQRIAGKTLYSSSHEHDSKFDGLLLDHSEELCDHRNLSPEKMDSVAYLLSKLFTTSFQLALPSLFRGMVQNIQDHVLKEKVLSFFDAGFNPMLLRSMSKEENTRQSIRKQLRLACDEELADVVLRLSTEDCFDLACDLAARHGRNLRVYGPPCACSFSHCLGCLEKLVNNVCNTPPLPEPPVRPVDRSELAHTLMELVEDEDSLASDLWKSGRGKDQKWVEYIGDAWQDMADTLWKTAGEMDPLQLPSVKEALEGLGKLDGLDLWYTIVMRELQVPSGPLKQSKGKKGTRASALLLSGEYDKMKKDNGKLKRPDEATDGADEEVACYGTEMRKAVARAVREQGNTSYAKGAYQEAAEQYTKAIGYDDEEAVYPLNRAACMVKLAKFPEAEADCSRAIELDKKNHKAYFRRGVSRAGLSKIDEAVDDFRHVLHLQQEDQTTFTELRKLSSQFLLQAVRKPGEVALSYDEVDRLLPKLKEVKVEETAQDSEESRSTGEESTCYEEDKEHTPSVSEVFSQVSFAVAFSHVVKQQTGVEIKVPVTTWNSTTASSL